MGRLDLPLNQQGREQVAQAAQALVEVGVDTIYTSPLARARESADIIREIIGEKTPVYITDWLTERGLGILEGLPKTPENRRALECTEGVESVDGFRQRLSGIDALLNSNQQLLLVSHSGVYKELIDFFNVRPIPNRPYLRNADWVQLVRN